MALSCMQANPSSGVQIGGCCSISACVLQLEPHSLDHHQLEKFLEVVFSGKLNCMDEEEKALLGGYHIKTRGVS